MSGQQPPAPHAQQQQQIGTSQQQQQQQRQQQQQQQQQQRQQQQQQQQQQRQQAAGAPLIGAGVQQQAPRPRPLLDWRLRFRDAAVERAFWLELCEQRHVLLLDKLVMLLNLLVLLNQHARTAQAAVTAALLLGQAACLAAGHAAYMRGRPWIMLAQRVWRSALRRSAPLAAPVQPAAACPARAAWRALLDAALVGSGVVPNWAHVWSYQAPVGTAPLLELACLLWAALADTAGLVRRLSAAPLQQLVGAWFQALSAASSWLLLPLLPAAALPAEHACPALPALPLVLWLQLFCGLLAPAYVTYQAEASGKARFWLRRLSQQRAVPPHEAAEAQQLLHQQVRTPAALLRHTGTLLLLAALSWQALELVCWCLPDSWLRQLQPAACA